MPFLTIFIQAYKLCSTGEGGLDLSYECLTSKQARTALTERLAASPEFAKSLQRPETTGVEEEEVDEDDPMDEGAVLCDEIDSSKMIDEEVEALILQEPTHLPMNQVDIESDYNDVQIVGPHVEKYTGCEFSSRAATNWWMEWDATSHI